MKRPASKPSRLVGYCRVSTEEQAREGVSLDAQREKIEQCVALYGYDLTSIEVDAGVSGKSLDRPALARALKLLDSGAVDGLLVLKLDRLTRRVADLVHLLERYFKDGERHLISVSEQLDTHSAAGRLLVHILASVAEWERETIAERVRTALAHLKAKGIKLGREGLGWERLEEVDDDGRKLVRAVGEEARTVKLIVKLRDEGMTLREIASELVAQGRKTKRGGRWQPQTVKAVLARAYTIGQ